MPNLNLYLTYLITALGVIITLIAGIANLKQNTDGIRSHNTLTVWGKWFCVFSVLLLLINVGKVLIEISDKNKEENIKALNIKNEHIFKDSVYSSLNTILARSGLRYNIQNNQVTIFNQQAFEKNFNTSILNVVNSSDENSRSGDTINTLKHEDDEAKFPDIDLGVEGKEITSNTGSYRAYGQCKFINKLSIGITMYYGECISNNMGLSKGVYNISPGRTATSDPLLIGISNNGGQVNPLTAKFEFYFASNNPSKPKLYGKIAVKITALKESTIQLDEGNLILTTTGARNINYLKNAGIAL